MFPPKVGDYSMAEDDKDNEIKKKMGLGCDGL